MISVRYIPGERRSLMLRMPWLFSSLLVARSRTRTAASWRTPISCIILAVLFLSSSWAASSDAAQKELHIFFVDVEGGQATLFVTAAGQSLLIDTGCARNNGAGATPLFPRPE